MTYSYAEIIMRALAGLGLLFVGLKTITRNLNAIAGDQLRRTLQHASKRTGAAMLLGGAAGFVTQSGRTTSFIMASFVQAGLIEARQALPIVLWANLGCTLVIFSAVFPVYLFALFLLGVAGVCVAFEKPKPLLNSASAVFGLALMLLGLQMMSSSASVLTSFGWFATALAFVKSSLILAFAMGLVLTLVAQSHIAVVLISLAMASKGIFSLEQTLMVIFGAQAGASVITLATGIHFRGRPRQVVAAQILYGLFGVGLFLAVLLALQAVSGGGGLRLWVNGGPASVGREAAIIAAVLNAVTPLLLTLGINPLDRLCVRLAPPLSEEDLGEPQFLREEAGDNPVAVLLLAEQEQLRLLRRLPIYCAWIRGEAEARGGTAPQVYHEAFLKVGRCIERFQNGLMSQRMSAEDTEWLMNQQKRQQLLEELDGACWELCAVTEDLSGDAAHLRDVIVESIDTLLLTAVSGMAHHDAAELDALETMTRNRGPAMERMRKRFLGVSDQLPPESRNRILQITSLFERGAWSLHRLGQLLKATPGYDAAAPADVPTAAWTEPEPAVATHQA